MNTQTNIINLDNRLDTLINTLGSLKAEAKILSDQIKAVETELKSEGIQTIETDIYKCTVSESIRSTVNYKKICADIKVSSQRLIANTKKSHIVSLRLTRKL